MQKIARRLHSQRATGSSPVLLAHDGIRRCALRVRSRLAPGMTCPDGARRTLSVQALKFESGCQQVLERAGAKCYARGRFTCCPAPREVGPGALCTNWSGDHTSWRQVPPSGAATAFGSLRARVCSDPPRFHGCGYRQAVNADRPICEDLNPRRSPVASLQDMAGAAVRACRREHRASVRCHPRRRYPRAHST
jgi:hypothetical protein